MRETKNKLFGEPSWIARSDQVELAVTERGGHMGPVTFYRQEPSPVRPYYLNPWHGEKLATGLPLLDVLRGDFFCMPFGAANDYKGENHPVHGESSNSTWSFESLERRGRITTLSLSLEVEARPGRITKTLSLAAGHNVVYCSHLLEGLAGRMCLSHHATLDIPEEEGSLLVSSSLIRFGRVSPRAARLNSGNEYYFLQPGATFKSLGRVPTVWKEPAYEDCSSFPRRYGFMDLQRFEFLVRAPRYAGDMQAPLRRMSIAGLDRDLYPHQGLIALARGLLMKRAGRSVREVLGEIAARQRLPDAGRSVTMLEMRGMLPEAEALYRRLAEDYEALPQVIPQQLCVRLLAELQQAPDREREDRLPRLPDVPKGRP